MTKKKKWTKPAGAPPKEIAKPKGNLPRNINGYPVFRFDMIDRDGVFAFDLSRKDFDHKTVLGKLMEYSCTKWTDILMQTHDKRNKSKHHCLKDERGLSSEARERLRKMKQDDNVDALFSFALTNKLRIIGLRVDDDFHVLWYDPQHGVYPSQK